MSYTTNITLWCMNCGKEGIPIRRKGNLLKKSFHRKKMYCPWCKTYVNHVECHSDEDIKLFKEAYEQGEFKEEAQQSITFCERKIL